MGSRRDITGLPGLTGEQKASRKAIRVCASNLVIVIPIVCIKQFQGECSGCTRPLCQMPDSLPSFAVLLECPRSETLRLVWLCNDLRLRDQPSLGAEHPTKESLVSRTQNCQRS